MKATGKRRENWNYKTLGAYLGAQKATRASTKRNEAFHKSQILGC